MPTSEKIVLLLFLLAVAGVYMAEASLVALWAYRRLREKRTGNIFLSKPALVIHVLAAIGIICFLYGWVVEPKWIEVNIIPIQTDKLNTASFRIVQMSDLHCDRKPRNEKRLVALINQLSPDVIVFTGDALNRASALPLFKDTMRNLKASLAKLAVRGNFDRHHKGLDYYSQTGFELLEATTVTLTKSDEMISVSGLSCDNPAGLSSVFEDVPPERFSIFLYHFSDLVESLEGLNVDLYLSGHTHGGQVALPFYGALITLSKFGKKYESGLYNVGDTILYVNRGIGLEPLPAPQVRFLARPEITVFDIAPKK